MKKALAILTGLLLTQFVFAGNALKIGLLTSPPASADTGTAFSFDVYVKNDSAFSFVGAIDFSYWINFYTDTGSDTVSGFSYTTFIDSLGPFDSTVRTLTAHVNGPAFVAGPSVVVIWPSAIKAYAKDSIYFFLNVTTGIVSPVVDYPKAYLSGGFLHIEKDASISLKRVRISDVLGRIILDEQSPSDNIPLPQQNTGLYSAEIFYNNNQRKIFRFYL